MAPRLVQRARAPEDDAEGIFFVDGVGFVAGSLERGRGGVQLLLQLELVLFLLVDVLLVLLELDPLLLPVPGAELEEIAGVAVSRPPALLTPAALSLLTPALRLLLRLLPVLEIVEALPGDGQRVPQKVVVTAGLPVNVEDTQRVRLVQVIEVRRRREHRTRLVAPVRGDERLGEWNLGANRVRVPSGHRLVKLDHGGGGG